jgi:hypothetical protein
MPGTCKKLPHLIARLHCLRWTPSEPLYRDAVLNPRDEQEMQDMHFKLAFAGQSHWCILPIQEVMGRQGG